jgi:hypothetical protein
MARPQLARHFIEAMAKHLPPSASTMQLVDIGGRCSALLADLREDLEIQSVIPPALAQLPSSSMDAATAFDMRLSDNVLSCALEILRPGGRFIAVLTSESADESWLRLLQGHGFTRILVEAAVDGVGLLIRGEKAHQTADTLQRIRSVAMADDDLLDLSAYRGRYLQLLIRQSPNKPVWKLRADETIRWRALALRRESNLILLAFSSLPKAVGFLQQAVLDGAVHDINKVGKFDTAAARKWSWDLLLNPTPEVLRDGQHTWLEIDPETAVAPDE